ncbi:conserved hypothetical protein [Candida dubliniensis CD36]|uniref:Uncharacterized protein n=1 Tax=Candida dubliniensis (strain CD36 / ATCC MYA-646 / CBS 7987 / NCPF 3949 / NRRL Y-17841) TaxID=573826 RepID=B9WAG3_CANDC|nr:conserved hypothetical protein [Candida dubliniensis CD36]CAX43383.1 conserved hypothetical protein [Candida dubliniensis CD36]
MQSLKSIIESGKIKAAKLREFDLVFANIDSYVEVPFIPNSSTYKNMPIVVAKDGTQYKYKEAKEYVDKTEASVIISSSPCITSDKWLLSDADIGEVNGTLPTTQSDSILTSQSNFDSEGFTNVKEYENVNI